MKLRLSNTEMYEDQCAIRKYAMRQIWRGSVMLPRKEIPNAAVFEINDAGNLCMRFVYAEGGQAHAVLRMEFDADEMMILRLALGMNHEPKSEGEA